MNHIFESQIKLHFRHTSCLQEIWSEFLLSREITSIHLSHKLGCGWAAGTHVTWRSFQIWGRVHTVTFKTLHRTFPKEQVHRSPPAFGPHPIYPCCSGRSSLTRQTPQKSDGKGEAKTDFSSQMTRRFLVWWGIFGQWCVF